MKEAAKDSKKRVTIYSVAREAGVSLATVSRVINESDVVKEDTKRKVQEAIIKLGYKPNAVAQGLALKKTTNIALIIPDSSFTYIGKVLTGLLDVAKIYKYNIVLHTTSVGVNEMNEIIDKYKPDEMAIEELFFGQNVTTGIGVAQSRGVILLAIRQAGLEVTSYKPMQVKQAVVGYGNATKHQVQDMTKRLLRLTQMPKPDDAADAIAIALCHARASTSLLAKATHQR